MDTIRWHKSSYSNPDGPQCVEIAKDEHVLIRDTQNRELGHLAFDDHEWSSALKALKH